MGEITSHQGTILANGTWAPKACSAPRRWLPMLEQIKAYKRRGELHPGHPLSPTPNKQLNLKISNGIPVPGPVSAAVGQRCHKKRY